MSEGAIIWGCGFCLSSVKAKTQIVQSKAKLAMRGKAIRLGIILLSSLLIFCLVSVELVEAGRLIENTSNDYTTPSPSDEIARPWLGYTTRPMRVVRIEDFSLEQALSAAEFRSNYEVALIFSTKYEPGPALWDRWRTWTKLKTRFFGFHRDLPPAAAAHILGGHIAFSEEKKGQWIAVIELERVEEARTPSIPASVSAFAN